MLRTWRSFQIPFSAADEKLAAALFVRSVALTQIERGIMLACARKYVALCKGGDGMSTSFGYFQNVIEETATLHVSDDYWRHLQHRLKRLELEWAGKTHESAQGAGQGGR